MADKLGKLTAVQRSLRKSLEQFRDCMGTPPRNLVYRGGYDFVLQHGQFYRPMPLPKRVKRGAPRCCFGNAICLAALSGWDYVEGYALSPHCENMPVHHAWNVRPDGRMIDNTWDTIGTAYMGVVFSLGRADDATWFGNANVLDDWERGWPLLQQRWQGEPEDAVWPQSPPLAKLLETGQLQRVWEE